MIEMLGVLAIIGVLSAGGIWGYNQAVTQYRINQTIDDVQTMASNAKALFIGKPSAVYKMITAKQLQALGIIPSKYKLENPSSCNAPSDRGCFVKSLFGEDMKIYAEDGYSAKSKILVVQFYGLSPAVCMKLVSYDWRKVVPNHDWVIYKNGSAVKSGYEAFTMDNAKLYCGDTPSFLQISLFLNNKGNY